MVKMNSPDSARDDSIKREPEDISIKQEEPEDHSHLNILHVVVCKEEDSIERERSPSLLQEEPEPPHIKEEQEELLQRPEDPDGSILTLVKSEHDDDDEDVSSHFSEVEVKLESDTEVTEDSDDWEEETSGGVMSQSSQTRFFSCSECSYSFTSQDFLYKHIKRSHNDLYCQMLRSNGQQITTSAAASGQIIDSVTSRQRKADTDQPTSSSGHGEQSTDASAEPGEAPPPPPPTTTTLPGRKPHVCKFCEKGFGKSDSLTRHQRVHTGEKPFRCERCDKGFSQAAQLKTHRQRFHTAGERKPFRCERCDKGFSVLSHLKDHQRVHTGEKPFHCKYCDESFAWSATLKRHQQYVHTGADNPDPFRCESCEKSFTTASSLKRHRAVHAGEGLYRCEDCDRTFSKLGSLKTHRRIHFFQGKKRSTVD